MKGIVIIGTLARHCKREIKKKAHAHLTEKMNSDKMAIVTMLNNRYEKLRLFWYCEEWVDYQSEVAYM